MASRFGSVTSDFLRRQWHAFARGLIENGSTYAPAKERFDGLQRLVRGDRSSTLFDGRDQLNNVPLADLVNALAGPCPASFSTKQPCDFSAGAVLGKTLGDVAFQQLLHPICHCSSLALPFLRSRIPALELRCEHLLRCHVRLMKGHAAIWPDGVFA
jgi:hypothetical protein